MNLLEQRPTTLRHLFRHDEIIYKPPYTVAIQHLQESYVFLGGFYYGLVEEVEDKLRNYVCNKEQCLFFEQTPLCNYTGYIISSVENDTFIARMEYCIKKLNFKCIEVNYDIN